MPVNLRKGQRVEVGLTHVKIGLGWDPNIAIGAEFDLDASCFMLDETEKAPSADWMIFYGNKFSPDGAVEGADDDQSGGATDGDDDEIISIDLTKVSPQIQSIVFVATIYEAKTRNQNFGQVNDARIRLINAKTDEVMYVFDLSEDCSTATGVEFAKLYRHGGVWKYQAIGNGYDVSSSLKVLGEKYTNEIFEAEE
ncbi:TerD family protein [Flammeovirga aprica]|uniref:TerD family protein n=1 Tax=Flammeovirga aprica JL-4 TaxID=694437 RepID=A0A7X9RWR1_9BACT|nr:TerD family protein [Flammeovirga aprica]NME70118.1 TerD family protein [Flammeovirga aprica JL-4]